MLPLNAGGALGGGGDGFVDGHPHDKALPYKAAQVVVVEVRPNAVPLIPGSGFEGGKNALGAGVDVEPVEAPGLQAGSK